MNSKALLIAAAREIGLNTKQGRAIDLLSFALNYPNSIKGE